MCLRAWEHLQIWIERIYPSGGWSGFVGGLARWWEELWGRLSSLWRGISGQSLDSQGMTPSPREKKSLPNVSHTLPWADRVRGGEKR